MKIILTTETASAAVVLKNQIIAAVKGEIDGVKIENWSYTTSGEKYDIIFYSLGQHMDAPENNVLFKIVVEGSEVAFSTGWWKSKPEPSRVMQCLHIGRLAEMLLRYFPESFIKFSVVDF